MSFTLVTLLSIAVPSWEKWGLQAFKTGQEHLSAEKAPPGLAYPASSPDISPPDYAASRDTSEAWENVAGNRRYTSPPHWPVLPRSRPLNEMSQGRVLKDWGRPCTSGSQCASGVCGTSCSYPSPDLDMQEPPDNSTSCMCPCNSNDVESDWWMNDGTEFETRMCCCGCASSTRGAQGRAFINDCGGHASSNALLQVASAQEPRLVEQKVKQTKSDKKVKREQVLSWEQADEAMKANKTRDSLSYEYNPIVVERGNGQKTYGETCSSIFECRSGICGTGCDCDSTGTGLAVCSCNVPCNAPYNCCGGCFIDNNPLEVMCPRGVIVEAYGNAR